MKTGLIRMTLLSGIALLGTATNAMADSAAATCEVSKEGEARQGVSGPCTFSQRQGNINLDLTNGNSYSLVPTGKTGEYRDQKGHKVVRTTNGKGAEEFTWEGGKKILLTFAGSPGAAAPASSGAAGAAGRRDEFGTVCGVMVNGQNFRYRCTATDIYSGSQKSRTVLRYPDQTIELTWKPGNRVGLQFEGMTPQEARYASSEGETNFVFEDKTYFYYSDKGAARMELQNFRD